MPEIDISQFVLLNPVIAATEFQVVRRRSWTDNSGIARQSSVTVGAIGSVTPEDSTLDREDAFQSQPRTLVVVTQFFLRNAAQDVDDVRWQPDLVLWQGNHFLVRSLEDFSQFGGGFTAAKCDLFEYVPSPPLGNPPSVNVGRLDLRQRSNSGLIGVVSW